MRLIDADAVHTEIENRIFPASNLDAYNYNIGINDALSEIEDAETVDAVPVVRCKDCEFHQSDDYSNFYGGYWCAYSESFTSPEGYCYLARKMEETSNETD